jgi:hypothetical protein
MITRWIIISALHEILEALKINYDRNDDPQSNKEKSDSLVQNLRNITGFLMTGFKKDSMKVFEKLKKDYSNEYFIYTPLMFDLIFCFQEAYDEPLETLSNCANEHQNEFDELFMQFEVLKTHMESNAKLWTDKKTLRSAESSLRKIFWL